MIIVSTFGSICGATSCGRGFLLKRLGRGGGGCVCVGVAGFGGATLGLTSSGFGIDLGDSGFGADSGFRVDLGTSGGAGASLKVLSLTLASLASLVSFLNRGFIDAL